MITKLRGNGSQFINNIFGRFGNQELPSDQTATVPPEVHPMKEFEEDGGHGPSLHEVLDTVDQHFGPSIATSTEACISSQCSLLIANATGCVALVIEGSPSSGKTESLGFLGSQVLQEADLVLVSDSFTPASFVSHAPTRTTEQLTKTDLLPLSATLTLRLRTLRPSDWDRFCSSLKLVGLRCLAIRSLLPARGYDYQLCS